MITVMGATGHTGKKVAAALLKAGEKVRALGRSESKLSELQAGQGQRRRRDREPEAAPREGPFTGRCQACLDRHSGWLGR